MQDKTMTKEQLELLEIPGTLNLIITLIMVPLLGLFIVGINGENTVIQILSFIGFSGLFITNYSMVHEAGHDKAHKNEKLNYLIGFLGSLFFLSPYSHCKEAHWNHHLRNRSHKECFDLILPGDSAFAKKLSWYIYLTGVWFPMYPVGCAMMLLVPGATFKLYNRLNSKIGNFQEGDHKTFVTRLARFELFLIVLFHIAFASIFNISVGTYLICYLLGTAWWCTLQYVEHAFAPTKPIEGSWNLKVSKWFGLLSLHRSLDLNHHKYPRVSWYKLPLVDPQVKQEELSILSLYFRMWKGPIHVSEKPHAPLKSYKANYLGIKKLSLS